MTGGHAVLEQRHHGQGRQAGTPHADEGHGLPGRTEQRPSGQRAQRNAGEAGDEHPPPGAADADQAARDGGQPGGDGHQARRSDDHPRKSGRHGHTSSPPAAATAGSGMPEARRAGPAAGARLACAMARQLTAATATTAATANSVVRIASTKARVKTWWARATAAAGRPPPAAAATCRGPTSSPAAPKRAKPATKRARDWSG